MQLKRLLFLFLILAGITRAQLNPAPSSTGSITTNAANCFTTNACIVLHMASSNVGYSVTVSGTWTGTLTVEQSGDNQGSWTSATTTTGNTLYTSALTPGITDVRVRGSAAMTGTAVVTITASGPATLQQITQTGGSGGITSVATAPSGACSPNGSTQILNVTPVQIYKCVAGFWQPDFSTVIDAKAYGVKADGKLCFGSFVTTTNTSQNISCVSTLTAIGASVTANVATLTFYGNPLTVGALPWASGDTVVVTAFAGGDSFFNGTYTLTGATASTITYALVHANASATSNGVVANNSKGYFSAADVGKIIFATDGGGGLANSAAGLLRCPQSTITSVTNSVTAVSGIACTFTMSALSTAVLVWGSDDTAALDLTSNALANVAGCGTVLLPMGTMLTSHGQWQVDSPACVISQNGLSIAYGSGARVLGFGPAVSVIVPTPTFNFQTFATNSIFGSPNFMVYDSWSVYGAGLSTNGNNSLNIVNMNTESVAYNFQIVAWLGADAATTGLTMNGRIFSTRVQGAGGIGCTVSGTAYVVNSVCNYSKTRGLNVPGGTIMDSVNSSFGATPPGTIAALIDGVWNSKQDQVFTLGVPTNNIALQVNSTAKVNLDADKIGINTSANTCVGLYNHGGAVHAKNTEFQGCTSGNAVQEDTSATFFDDGGNTYLSSTVLLLDASNINFVPLKSIIGACTGVVTASQTLGLYGTGPNETLTTCTSTTIGSGQVMDHAGTLQFLHVSAGVAGVNASSGVVTILKNGAGTTITCTIGTGTFCQDGQHTVSFVTGDLISANFTTQAADTLSGVKAFAEVY